MKSQDEVVIIGGGIGGLTLALALHRDGVPFRVYEAVPEIKPLGVGLNLLPHAMRELAGLGLEPVLRRKGIATQEYRFYTRHGQLVLREPRGQYAGYEWPQIAIHRGDLQFTLLEALIERAGPDVVVQGHRCVKVEQDEDGATVHFIDPKGQPLPPVRGPVAVACDGVNSVVRVQMHPKEAVPRYEGTLQYRGTTRWKPYLTGATHVYLGANETGKLVMYPIRDNIDGEGTQLINWVIEVKRPTEDLKRDWNRRAEISDFIHHFEHAKFDWMDIPAMMRAAEAVYEYPMIDQDPLPFWTEGRVTLLGDAAHPMMPRGSNGAAQAIIDATTLSRLLVQHEDPRAALKEYEQLRLKATSDVVLANRKISPDGLLEVVNERTGGKPFERLEDVITEQEIIEWQARYKKIAGFSLDDLRRPVNA